MKRVLDVMLSLLGLLLASPIALLTATAIWLTDGMPILFRQQRVGRWGREFTLLKFRTMTQCRSAQNGTFDAGDTSRVTRVGGVLRYWKLDELPQLWNVLQGDMSMVGPRPEVRRYVEPFQERWDYVHQIRPGITDPASIQFRHEEELLATVDDPQAYYRETILPIKLSIYEEYVSTASVAGDFRILLRTVAAVARSSRKAS